MLLIFSFFINYGFGFFEILFGRLFIFDDWIFNGEILNVFVCIFFIEANGLQRVEDWGMRFLGWFGFFEMDFIGMGMLRGWGGVKEGEVLDWKGLDGFT